MALSSFSSTAARGAWSDRTVTFWEWLHVVVVGWQPLAFESRYSIDEVKRRILGLAEPLSDGTLPALTVVVNDDIVEASYDVSADAALNSAPGHMGTLSIIRPVFRGRLVDAATVMLLGRFG